ncbi:MAG TPA: deoxynucleoside kinase [Myxococcota bacterium]|nr:deoxynucleoside kinase [Myxococcota bacterium]HND30209.1 deoxynucleoside kinase [Myxococcota bacterium]HNH49842.1 deoxynucleoside kinase [Myxococcota bacterium]
MKKFIAVAGNMGVGKTSLVEFLTSQYGFEPVYEPYTTNPYLDDFYAEMGRWAFHSQVYFLSHKFRLHLGLNDSTATVVQDRTIYEDAEIFATNLGRTGMMNARDFQTYMELYQSMRGVLQPPDLMIYLRCPVRSIRQRIKRRGRPSELAIPVDYLRNLNSLYEEWVARYDLSPVMIWESATADYLTSLVDRIEFKRTIEKFL